MNNAQKWEDISSGIAIRTDVYQPKIVDNKDSGMLEFVRQRTFKEVRDQFEDALKAIYVESWEHSAFGAVEYISFQDYDQNVALDFPKGCLRILVCDGNCEGTRIEVMILDQEHNLRPMLSAKFLSDRTEVWNIGMKIDEACSNGCFGY